MTIYAYDEARRVLIGLWETGNGHVAREIAETSDEPDAADLLGLAAALTSLSHVVWRTYTLPASAADGMEPNGEAWRRQGERDAFANVLGAIKSPDLPVDGTLVQSYIQVEEAAHRVGRALHRIGDERLVDHVCDEVGQELAAVERAELGDLSGRARQAVRLTRADASPL
ncbi:hypothetical protein ACFYOT_25255 [Saccharothrix saharensis]|uniref:hypothetical protein n=1 Tax=Saccharothrix saharensis TaxID=571190 RepID=UPI0036AF0ADA